MHPLCTGQAAMDAMPLSMHIAGHSECLCPIPNVRKYVPSFGCACQHPLCPTLSGCALQGRVVHGIEDMLPKTEAAHEFAQGVGDLLLSLSRLPYRVSAWSQNMHSSIKNQVHRCPRTPQLLYMLPLLQPWCL